MKSNFVIYELPTKCTSILKSVFNHILSPKYFGLYCDHLHSEKIRGVQRHNVFSCTIMLKKLKVIIISVKIM